MICLSLELDPGLWERFSGLWNKVPAGQRSTTVYSLVQTKQTSPLWGSYMWAFKMKVYTNNFIINALVFIHLHVWYQVKFKRLNSIENQLIILDWWITVQIGNGPYIICAGVSCLITDQMLKSSCIRPHVHLLICTHRSVQWPAVDISVPGINPHTQSIVEMDSWKVFYS